MSIKRNRLYTVANNALSTTTGPAPAGFVGKAVRCYSNKNDVLVIVLRNPTTFREVCVFPSDLYEVR